MYLNNENIVLTTSKPQMCQALRDYRTARINLCTFFCLTQKKPQRLIRDLANQKKNDAVGRIRLNKEKREKISLQMCQALP